MMNETVTRRNMMDHDYRHQGYLNEIGDLSDLGAMLSLSSQAKSNLYLFSLYRSLIHLFSWSGLMDANILLSDLFIVPNLQTTRMEPLKTALLPEEKEMACNMLRQLNTIFSVE